MNQIQRSRLLNENDEDVPLNDMKSTPVDEPVIIQIASDEKTTQRRFLKWRRLVLTSLLVAYLAFFFVRSHASITMPQILASTGLSKSQFGVVISFGFGAQAVGKIVNGILADRKGGKLVLLTALHMSILISALFAIVGYLHENRTPLAFDQLMTLFVILWSMNRFAQSAAWGAILKILPYWFHDGEYGRVMGLFALSYGYGDAMVRALLGAFAQIDSIRWYDVWWIGCLFAFVCGLPSFWLVLPSPTAIGCIPPTNKKQSKAKAAANGEEPPKSAWASMKALFRSYQFWMIVFLYVGLTLIREAFNSWTTQFLTDHLALSNSEAAIASLTIPLFAATSALIGGWLFDRLTERRKELLPAVFLSVSLVALVAITICTHYDYDNVALNLFLLACVSFGMETPYTLIDGVYTLKISGKNSPALTVGIIQAAGNTGAIASGYLVGLIAETYGWSVLMALLSGLLAVLHLSTILAYIYSPQA